MGIYFEALLLYIILFLAGSLGAIGNIPQEAADFSVLAEVYKITLYLIPSIALIWYLYNKQPLSTKKDPNGTGAAKTPGSLAHKRRILKLCKNDFLSFLFALPCLLITGFFTALLPSFFGDVPAVLPYNAPSSFLGWTALCFTCFFAAYLEESYFRFYLLSKRKEMGLGEMPALIISVALFSVCHIYEGPWGFLNSVISGGILAFLFLRYRSLHGIAAAHGVYNIAAYAVNAMLMR